MPSRERTLLACLRIGISENDFVQRYLSEHAIELRFVPEIAVQRDVVDKAQKFIRIDGIVVAQGIQRRSERL